VCFDEAFLSALKGGEEGIRRLMRPVIDGLCVRERERGRDNVRERKAGNINLECVLMARF